MGSLASTLNASRSVTIDVVTTVSGLIFTVTAIKVTQLLLKGQPEKIIRHPGQTLLPTLGQKEIDALPYPPDCLPGGRDVNSPYGQMRVFEFGPEDGKKILFIHGLTTPCISLGAVAQGMADRGCRVMLYDLWGRGYSDSPDLPHDERLYTTQILLALTSSPIPWTGAGSNGFSIIAYSLGACVAVPFTAHAPTLVNDLILFCPTGLIRSKHLGRQRRVLFAADWIPEWIMSKVVRSTLQKPMYAKENAAETLDQETGLQEITNAELPSETKPPRKHKYLPASKKYPDITVVDAIRWHLTAHPGFVRSFMSSLRYSPITGLAEEWKLLGQRKSKTLIFAGTTDPIIVPDEIKEDAGKLLGDRMEYRLIEGAHDIPNTESERLCDEILEFWGN